jgi:hypothetical protein
MTDEYVPPVPEPSPPGPPDDLPRELIITRWPLNDGGVNLDPTTLEQLPPLDPLPVNVPSPLVPEEGP